jgi:hypothetical protein
MNLARGRTATVQRVFGLALRATAVAMLCLCVAACGRTGRETGSALRPASTAASSGGASATNPASPASPSPSIAGDYDSDDDYGNGPFSDGDDDNGVPADRDGDSDNSSGSYYDPDDNSVRRLGHAADAEDRRAIVRLVRRYFAAAVAEDGAAACSMVRRSLARAVPEDYGRSPAQPYARGTTCAQVMSGIFKHYHRQLAAHARILAVSDVRVDPGKGVAVLAFRGLPARQMGAVREGGAWRIRGLLDTELP